MTTQPPLPFAAAGISAIVPVYNEAPGVRATLTHLSTILGSLPWPYEIIVIDDGSTDASANAIAAVADPAIRVIRHATNQGYGASLTAGLHAAHFPSLVITDADGTYPLATIPLLLAGLDQHVMAVGARVGTNVHIPIMRRPIKWALRRLAEGITGQSIPDLNSGLRAMRKEAILPIEPLLPQRFSWTSTITIALLLQKQPVQFLPIAYYRRQGTSKIHPFWDTVRALQCIWRATGVLAMPDVSPHPAPRLTAMQKIAGWFVRILHTSQW
ncbi:MAG: glycosyltransferase family 2 protein [Blastochloris sp.]|nr:glycosyltransferase family 2 protein [Blastochloris sp.]